MDGGHRAAEPVSDGQERQPVGPQLPGLDVPQLAAQRISPRHSPDLAIVRGMTFGAGSAPDTAAGRRMLADQAETYRAQPAVAESVT